MLMMIINNVFHVGIDNILIDMYLGQVVRN